MLRVRMHARLLILAACVTLAALLLTLVPTFAVHAASGFTAQTRLGFPAGDDWEPALASDPKAVVSWSELAKELRALLAA